MGAFFVKGETKTRAGIYRRHEKREDAVTSSNDYRLLLYSHLTGDRLGKHLLLNR